MSKDEYEGYYCLLIAIFCDLDVTEARKMYKYGPEHPLCQKILNKKIRLPDEMQMDKKEVARLMKKLIQKGHSFNAVADAFGCYPSTVRRRIKKVEAQDKEEKAS